MSLWEYKIITSGKGGFASPALLEKFLNDLGREEWEIVQFHTQPDNFLVFTGLARRSTQRDWTLADAAAAAAKAEAEKLRAEFEAKFKAATSGAAAGPSDEPASFLEEKLAPDDGFRKPVDTSHDADAEEEEKEEEDDWDKLTAAEEDELPTFFDAIKPHMRKNQRGPGMSVGVDYLAKKWDQSEEDLKGALVECGFSIPADEDAKPEYLEFEGDLYWINVNRRGELWINTKEKPRPVFRAVKAQKVVVEEEQKQEKPQKQDPGERRQQENRAREEREQQQPAPAAASGPAGDEPAAEQPARAPQPEAAGAELPSGAALLEKIRPLMRRNRRGPGGSGSASFLSRALKVREPDLVAAFKSLGLVVPSSANEKPVNVEVGNGIWWVNVDSRGNVWINGRDKKPGETLEANGGAAEQTQLGDVPATQPVEQPGSAPEQLGAVPSVEAPAGEPSVTAAEAAPAPLPVPVESTPASAAPDGVPSPEVAPAATVEATAQTPDTAQPLSSAPNTVLATIRPLLKETRTGSIAAKLDRLAGAMEKSPEELESMLVGAGLVVPEKPREKPVFVEHGSEIFWLNRNARGELWLNAKSSKPEAADDAGEPEGDSDNGDEAGEEKKARRPRGRRK